jgi:hypothetical protein
LVTGSVLEPLHDDKREAERQDPFELNERRRIKAPTIPEGCEHLNDLPEAVVTV